jgi:hypothetical protein
MKFILNKKYNPIGNTLLEIITSFNTQGIDFVIGKRNSIKLFEIQNQIINIKSFKNPNIFNKIVYHYIRKSKANRSFEYATQLLAMGIGTPEPIAFLEKYDWLGLNKSYYASEHIEDAFELREVLKDESFEKRELILRKFVQFTFLMHQNGIEFLDHSPGNTLIRKNENTDFSFYLVDLNRMKFCGSLNFQTRMKNLSKITSNKAVISIMSNEYAKLSGEPEATIFETMWKFTSNFQFRFQRKKKIKNKIVFWKK